MLTIEIYIALRAREQCDRRSQISGQTTAQPKTKSDLSATVSHPSYYFNTKSYIFTNLYLPLPNSNLSGSVTAIKLYNKAVQVSRKIMLSKETTYSQARMNLASVLDQVCDEPQIINYFLA